MCGIVRNARVAFAGQEKEQSQDSQNKDDEGGGAFHEFIVAYSRCLDERNVLNRSCSLIAL